MFVFTQRYQILVAVAFFALILLYAQHQQPRFSGFGNAKGAFDGRWVFERDAQNLMLSDAQCDQAFPGLFKEIDRAVERRRSKAITMQEIDEIVPSNGFVRAMIYNQKLYMIDSQGTFFSREHATIHAIHRAILTSTEPLPNIEFTFLTDDIVRPQPQWAYSRKETDQAGEELWLMPDFGYWAWPEPKIGSYSEVQMKATMKDAQVPWKEKIGKLVWRGATMGLPIRDKLIEVTKDTEWADVRALDWRSEESVAEVRLSMDEHCKYKYLAHTEGTSNSGRLKYLQNCRSVVVAHTLEWVQHHHHLMVASGPKQNYVEVKRDFSNLEEKIKELQQQDGKAEEIAERGVKTFRERYLTPAAETCYWRKLIRGWAKVSFEPPFFNTTGGETTWRGLPVESFFLERRMDWKPY